MRVQRVIVAILAAAALIVLLVGVPALLVAGLGNPLPNWAALKAGNLDDSTVLSLLGCIVWIAWLQWLPGTALEIAAAVRGVSLPRHISGGQGLSRILITAVIGVAIAAPLVSNTARAWASTAPTPAAAQDVAAVQLVSSGTPTLGQSGGSQTLQSGTDTHHASTNGGGPIYIVGSDPSVGPSLWSIAQHTLGNPLRWRDIWELNRGSSQPGGVAFNDPDEIRSGWQLRLPAGATVPAASSAHTVTVEAGDTLSGIADRAHVEEPDLFAANEGRSEQGGRQLTDPNLILPGWTVTIPTASAPVQTAPATHPHQAPTRRATPHKGEPGQTATPPQQPSTTPTSRPTGRATQTPATQAPATPVSPASPAVPQHAEPAHEARPAASAPATKHASDLPMVAFTGGGVLLAGVSLTALIGYRRRQFRQRHPGNTITSCAPELLRVERTLLSVGGPAVVDVTWLDQILRGLAHGTGEQDTDVASRLPDVVAARMSRDHLELILASAQPNAPAPWTVDETGTRWSIPRGEESDYDPAQRAYHFAPFPTLTSVGYAQDGSQWLLDLERVASMSLAGDPERCLNLARFVACELAHNTWSEILQVTLVGFGRELADINPDRLTYTEDFDAAIAELAEQAQTVGGSMRQTGLDLLDTRSRVSTGDAWAPHVLLIAPAAARDSEGLDRLLATMRAQHTRMAVAVVLSDDPDHADATTWTLTIDQDGTLHIPALGVDLTAQQIPADEAAELAQRLALAATPGDQPMPASAGKHPWDRFADAAGMLRIPADADDTDGADSPEDAATGGQASFPAAAGAAEGAAVGVNGWAGAADIPALHLAHSSPWMNTSVLPLPRETYLERSATTAEDLDALAPATNDEIREKVESTVGDLDSDLSEWYSESTVRPRVSVLGPVAVRAQGPLPPRNPRTLWHTEIVAYLATRPSGVSSERYATDLWPNDPDPELASKSKVRQSAMIVRKWLGKNPATGVEYLPPAMAPGYASYRIEDCLLDAELFRRLRLRGLARGASGIEDLWAALRLVTGEPFSERREDGYAWLAEMPLDHVYSAMIVDVAHTVATHHLVAGEPERAAEAAEVALTAGSREDVPLLDQVAACDAQDKRTEATAFIKRIYANHDVEQEEDLPPRTAEVLRRRQWLDTAS